MTLLANLVAGTIGVVILLIVAVVFFGRDRPVRHSHAQGATADRDGSAAGEGGT
jgi:hypothetical protein